MSEADMIEIIRGQVEERAHAVELSEQLEQSDHAERLRARSKTRRGIVPIIGARTSSQPAENLATLELDLTADEADRLDQVSSIELGFRHDFDTSSLVYGTTEGLIDDHPA